MNLVIITSLINISKKPLSYSLTRSFCESNKRFIDTKLTIESVKKYIPNSQILLIECSELENEYEKYLIDNTEYFINYSHDSEVLNIVNSISKSFGEGIMTIKAIEYINSKNIQYQNLFKLSGRYWLNDTFNFEIYNNNFNIVKKIEDNINNILTCFYKLNASIIPNFLSFLKESFIDFNNCIGYEVIFSKFINKIDNVLFIKNKIGINGYVSVCGTYVYI